MSYILKHHQYESQSLSIRRKTYSKSVLCYKYIAKLRITSVLFTDMLIGILMLGATSFYRHCFPKRRILWVLLSLSAPILTFSSDHICNEADQCSNNNIVCLDNENCLVQCLEARSCDNSNITAPTTGNLTVICSGALGCRGANIVAPKYGYFDIDCTASSQNWQCYQATLNATSMVSGSLSVRSTTSKSMQYTRVYCPGNQNECNVVCGYNGCDRTEFFAHPDGKSLTINAEDGVALQNAVINCAIGGTCNINAFGAGMNRLKDVNIYSVNGLFDVNIVCENSDISECYGTNLNPHLYCDLNFAASCDIELRSEFDVWDCVNNNSFIDMCNAIAPTNDPTKVPTLIPTDEPSTHPTYFPTSSPSKPPTTDAKLPTLPPTKTPTELPSKVPTKILSEGSVESPATTVTTSQPAHEEIKASSKQNLTSIITIICSILIVGIICGVWFYIQHRKTTLKHENDINMVETEIDLTATDIVGNNVLVSSDILNDDASDKIIQVISGTTQKDDTKFTEEIVDAEGDDNEKYEWIERTLKICDEFEWGTYLENFKRNKVEDYRLDQLSNEDWKELIPSIGPRNEFISMWKTDHYDSEPQNIHDEGAQTDDRNSMYVQEENEHKSKPEENSQIIIEKEQTNAYGDELKYWNTTGIEDPNVTDDKIQGHVVSTSDGYAEYQKDVVVNDDSTKGNVVLDDEFVIKGDDEISNQSTLK